MRLRVALLASLSVSALGGCATDEGDKSGGRFTPGKGDGTYDLVEAGPVAMDGTIEVTLDGRIPAYRVESYGNMRLDIAVEGASGEDAYVVVEGPLDGDGDRTPVGTGLIHAEDDDSGGGRAAKLEVTLAKPGVYRVIAGTFEAFAIGERPEGELAVRVACRDSCNRPTVDAPTFVAQLQATQGAAFAQLAKAKIAEMIPDAATAAALGAQLDAILADPTHAGLERFPTLSLAQLPLVRPALGAIPAAPPQPDVVITGELGQVLGACTPTRAVPDAIDPRLPGIGYGHFPRRDLSPCQFAHADTLAALLTSLAADNGSSVTFRGTTITTPRELFAALLSSGHTIRVRNERMFANFLSATIGDNADLLWPVWLDTGIRLSDGSSLTIPVGHSHHAWEISGPVVNTQVMFYLGTGGAGFFAQSSQRPAWSGNVASTDETVRAGSSKEHYLLDTVDTAATYLRRTRVERTTIAAGMPVDGYGYVGVCNDSNAVIELATQGTVSAFPLLRARHLDREAPLLNDGLDDILRSLPNDGDGIADARDALRRALAMQPFGPEHPLLWDRGFAAQLEVAQRDAH